MENEKEILELDRESWENLEEKASEAEMESHSEATKDIETHAGVSTDQDKVKEMEKKNAALLKNFSELQVSTEQFKEQAEMADTLSNFWEKEAERLERKDESWEKERNKTEKREAKLH